jgi:hypothetical protein
VRALFRFLKSVRLAVTLILLTATLSILATLIGAKDFFRSALFFSLAALFTLNLAACAVGRIRRRARSGEPRRYGPDIVHFGLLLLIGGGLLTFILRSERSFTMREGDEAKVSPSYTVSVLRLEYRRYEDGTPRAWVSTVRVYHGDDVELPAASIEVNKPLRLRGLVLYQSTFGTEGTLWVKDGNERTYPLSPGQGFMSGESAVYFSGVEDNRDGGWSAVFERWDGGTLVSRALLSAGDPLGPFTVDRVEGRFVSGLLAVNDPGAFPVICALAVIGIGLALSFIQGRIRVNGAEGRNGSPHL